MPKQYKKSSNFSEAPKGIPDEVFWFRKFRLKIVIHTFDASKFSIPESFRNTKCSPWKFSAPTQNFLDTKLYDKIFAIPLWFNRQMESTNFDSLTAFYR